MGVRDFPAALWSEEQFLALHSNATNAVQSDPAFTVPFQQRFKFRSLLRLVVGGQFPQAERLIAIPRNWLRPREAFPDEIERIPFALS